MEGITYSHEHMVIDLSKGKGDPDCYLNVYQDALDELSDLHSKGVVRIVDCSNHGIGVDYETNQRIQEKTGIHIVNSTGFYKDPFFPDYVADSSVDDLVQIMCGDIAKHHAEVIGEIGTSKDVFTADEKKVFEAACVAQKKTNTVIITHTTLGTLQVEQVQFFKQRNIDLGKVIISHVALKKDFDSICQILDMGVNVAFDTIGKTKYLDDAIRIEWIKKLIEMGYTGQLLMSMDCTRKSHLKKNGGPGYAYLIDSFVPRLIDAGVSQDSINQIMTKNFQAVLERGEL